MIQNIKLKKDVSADHFKYLAPDTFIVLGYSVRFCKDNNLRYCITNIIEKFKDSVSDSHPEGRAFDLSVNGWTKLDIKHYEAFMEYSCGLLGAISYGTGERKLTVVHDIGLGNHIHHQVRSLI